jgi:hypothetical protein
MGTRRTCLALALLLFPAAASAHQHNWEAAAAANSASGSQLWGGNFVVGKTVYRDPHEIHRWALLLDVGLNGGPHDGGSVSQQSALFAGRYSYWLTGKKLVLVPGIGEAYRPRLQFFLEGLGGVVRVKNEFPTVTTSGIQSVPSGQTRPALGLGTGLDFLFSDYGGLRGQVDFVRRLSAEAPRQHFFRFSVGVVYRFEHDKAH